LRRYIVERHRRAGNLYEKAAYDIYRDCDEVGRRTAHPIKPTFKAPGNMRLGTQNMMNCFQVCFKFSSSLLQVCFKLTSSLLQICSKFASILLQIYSNLASILHSI